ncbi:hypothetical protein O0Q50_22075 [Priestia aryabhattai]|uniref:Uncharacterized protein n=1 Tax=Priestia aryabhattai TaxID=412384 RepID=A0AAX6ND86_PRIAR|nr:hypothetical protein [Priestia aryabhattai]MDU9693871.1 hypothetical protein [Priestia aryabhattai]
MRITYYRGLNKNETYLASKKVIKGHFKDVERMSVVFGLSREYDIDSRCSTKLTIAKPVLISISYDREKEFLLSLYHISKSKLTIEAAAQFSSVVIPSIREWINNQRDKPSTAILGVEELIFSWNGSTYSKQELKYL